MKLWHWLLVLTLAIALGCGGGGGGGGSTSSTVSVSGSVVWIENLQPTTPVSSVSVGTKSTTTDPGSGFFSLDVPRGVTSATATYVPSGGAPVVRTFNFPTATADVDLGDIYIGPATTNIHGRLVSSADASPIVGGTVTFAGGSAISASDGTFTIPSVAYPTTNFSGFLSLSGVASATGFFNQSFGPSGLAIGTAVEVGDVALVPSGSSDPPGLPANLTVTVQPTASSAGALVTVKQGGSNLTSGTVGGDGRVQFWLPTGTYDLTATKGTLSGTQSTTLTTLTSATNATVTLK